MDFRYIIMKSFALVAGVAASGSHEKNKIYDAKDYMTKVAEEHNGVLYNVDAEGTDIKVLHVYGNSYERGYAQGLLIADDVTRFAWDQIDDFVKGQVTGVEKHLQNLPKWLDHAIMKYVLDPVGDLAVSAAHGALGWVFNTQRDYIEASPIKVLDEIKGMADAICSLDKHAKTDKCKKGAMEDRLRRVNMLPDLVQMQCSMMGAWGEATNNQGLI